MQKICKIFGPFDEREIDFYIHEMKDNKGECMNGFQKNLVFNLFYKFFADTQSIQAINLRDYVRLILASKKMLQDNRMVYMPYIISSKIDKIVKQILSVIATLITSNFRIIDYDDHNSTPSTGCNGDTILHAGKLNGQPLNIEADMIIEECLLYILLI